jgi:hypothetical protein
MTTREAVHVTVDQIDKAIHEVVKERPWFTYDAPNVLVKDESTGKSYLSTACVYVEREMDGDRLLEGGSLHPSCLIGHVFHRLGVELEDMDLGEDVGVTGLIDDLVSNGHLAIEGGPTEVETLIAALRSAQGVQDDGCPWQEALESYERTMPHHVEYPHEWGYLIDCPGCEARCWCTPGHAECVSPGPHVIPAVGT